GCPEVSDETMKKFMNDGGKCLLIENGEPIGVVLTIEEYEKLSELPLDKGGDRGGLETNKTLFPEIENKPAVPIFSNPIGEMLAQEMDYPAASANLNEIEAVDDVTLEDLGIDEEFSS
ncbi:MAG: hypothetical protein UV53_C0005G0035, partial [Candidatus Azambacteria bacterium GW2011_GWE1_42_9]